MQIELDIYLISVEKCNRDRYIRGKKIAKFKKLKPFELIN